MQLIKRWPPPRPVQFSLRWGQKIYTFLIVVNDRMLVLVIALLAFSVLFQVLRPRIQHQENNYYGSDALGYVMALLEVESGANAALEEQFVVAKQMLLAQALVKARVSRLDQLKDQELLALHRRIAHLFREKILYASGAPAHAIAFFADTSALHVIETALMEQVKFHVPASVKLAQAALETAYGKRVIGNNYFGIKSKNRSGQTFTTTEYYTAEELAHNRDKILDYKPVTINNRSLYRCRIQDRFYAYPTAWASFRAHSEFLHAHTRYAPLFRKGKNFEAWADAIGSSQYGGVGYATSPLYGELLKKIIRRYHLDLLDH